MDLLRNSWLAVGIVFGCLLLAGLLVLGRWLRARHGCVSPLWLALGIVIKASASLAQPQVTKVLVDGFHRPAGLSVVELILLSGLAGQIVAAVGWGGLLAMVFAEVICLLERLDRSDSAPFGSVAGIVFRHRLAIGLVGVILIALSPGVQFLFGWLTLHSV